MIKNKQENTDKDQKEQKAKSGPNENLGFTFSSSIKITDPKTKEVLLHKRCS